MQFQATSEILEVIKPYIGNANVSINDDFVMIDKKNHVGFDVMENEIIVFYFTNHSHFGEGDYIKLAKGFLLELFQYTIRHDEFFKGKEKSLEKYYIEYGDGREDKELGTTYFLISKFLKLFGRKSSKSTFWMFDKEKGCFSNRPPRKTDPNAVKVVTVNDDCYIEIFKRHNVYIYEIMEIYFDDYLERYYWTPGHFISSGFYDTEERAVEAAQEAIKCSGKW